MPAGPDVFVHHRRDACLVRISGELDLAATEHVRQALPASLPPVRCVLLDLDGLTFLDAAGLRTLMPLLRTARCSGAAVVARCRAGVIHRLLGVSDIRSLVLVDRQHPAWDVVAERWGD
jgi:anti-sigma B factor antagonist